MLSACLGYYLVSIAIATIVITKNDESFKSTLPGIITEESLILGYLIILILSPILIPVIIIIFIKGKMENK